MISSRSRLLALLLFVLFCTSAYSQFTFQRTLTDGGSAARSILETVEGGYIFTGEGLSVVKTNHYGEVIWSNTYAAGIGRCILQLANGDYLVVGETTDDLYVLKIDSDGNVKWSKTFGGSSPDYGWSAKETQNNGYIICGYTNSFGQGAADMYLLRLSANGTLMWSKTYGGTSDDYARSVLVTADGGFLLGGDTYSYGAGSSDIYLIKTDSSGNLIWSKTYGGLTYELGYSLEHTSDGNYVICGYTNSMGAGGNDGYLLKISTSGSLLWSKTYGGSGNDYCLGVKRSNDNGFIIAGYSNSFGVGNNDAYLIKTSEAGVVQWSKFYNAGLNDYVQGVVANSFGDFVLCGWTNSYHPGLQNEIYLIRTDAYGASGCNESNASTISGNGASPGSGGVEGIAATVALDDTSASTLNMGTRSICNNKSVLKGTVYLDADGDCVLDSTETVYPGWLIRVDPGGWYGYTDAQGEYLVQVDSGVYSVSLVDNDPLRSQICPSAPVDYQVSFNSIDDTIVNLDFAVEPDVFASLMTVDISTWAIRPCSTSVYTIFYCNEGTATAPNATITVELDNNMSYTSSSGNLISQVGNTLIFDVGAVPPESCGSFRMYVYITCDLNLVGVTLCIPALIIPDSTWAPPDTTWSPPDPSWDKSSMKVTGACVSDSLACFTVYNRGEFGNGNMQDSSEYRIYENNSLVKTGNFKLVGGDSLTICWPADGNTIRLEADQRPGHPGNSQPQDNIELCGDTLPDKMGQITVVPQDDADPFIDIECMIVTASLDPNDKLVQPAGIGEDDHFIAATDVLEYKIRFQNTGTDTAFLVVIRDTLSPYLDIASIRLGATSHPRIFTVFGTNVLEWRFPNILLPDSATNETESHGFVKFKIDQVAGNPLGTVIENRAGIVFDFNVPVMTDTAFNTIADMEQLAITAIPKYYDEHIALRVYPNPFTSFTTFEIAGTNSLTKLRLEIYNVIGERIRVVEGINSSGYVLNRSEMVNGIYIYKLLNPHENKLIASGKLIVN